MVDPRRWVDSDEILPRERELLRDEQRARPDPSLQSDVWKAVLGALPPPQGPDGIEGGGSPPTGGAEAGTAGAAGASALPQLSASAWIKPFVIGLLGGGVAMTAADLVMHAPAPSPRPTVAARASVSPATPAPLAPIAPAATATPPAAVRALRSFPPAPSPSPSANEPAPSVESTLSAERTALTRARAALRGGRSAEALAILETAQREIDRPMLGQEREVVAIQALGASGRTAEAKLRAARFLASFPDSPHAAIVRRFSEGTP